MAEGLKDSSRQSREKRRLEKDNNNSYNHDLPPDYWGHKLGKKRHNTTRVCFININGIGHKKKSYKGEEIRKFMESSKVDVMGMAETNVNWSKVKNTDTLWERTRSWFEHRSISVSYNRKNGAGKQRKQQGGTATLLKGKIAHGRWLTEEERNVI